MCIFNKNARCISCTQGKSPRGAYPSETGEKRGMQGGNATGEGDGESHGYTRGMHPWGRVRKGPIG